MTSYRLSQDINLQVALWAFTGAAWSAGRMVVRLLVALLEAAPYVFLALIVLAGGLMMFAAIAAIVTAVGPALLWGVVVIALFGWATFPRAKAVRA